MAESTELTRVVENSHLIKMAEGEVKYLKGLLKLNTGKKKNELTGEIRAWQNFRDKIAYCTHFDNPRLEKVFVLELPDEQLCRTPSMYYND